MSSGGASTESGPASREPEPDGREPEPAGRKLGGPLLRPLSRVKRKRFADLGSRAGRERRGLFLLEGPRAIEDALDRGADLRTLIVEESIGSLVREWSDAGRLPPGIAVYRATHAELADLADTTTPQGILAIGPLPPLTLESLPADPGPLTLLIDGLQDPGNLGTLLRTLAATGGRAALCARGTVDAYNPKALRAAAGATFAIRIAAGLGGGEAVEWCAARSIAVVALRAGAPDLFDARLPDGPLALAVGNEGAGLSREILDRSALVLGLPLSGGVESLSAAVAGSVALYVLAHRRGRRRP
ncbi:MAG TPA: RNA methyltransferase [Gemmatimonadota bacterium]|nr:RNA methyltransferase [Gemmatimonadota bacterium]